MYKNENPCKGANTNDNNNISIGKSQEIKPNFKNFDFIETKKLLLNNTEKSKNETPRDKKIDAEMKDYTEATKISKTEIKNYCEISQNQASNGIGFKLMNLKRKCPDSDIDLLGNGKFTAYGITFEVENFKHLQNYINHNTSKVLSYILFKLDLYEYITLFTLSDFMEFAKLEDSIESNKEVIKQFDIIASLGNIRCSNPSTFINDYLFKIKYHRRKGTIEVSKDFAISLRNTYAQFPEQLFKMKGATYLLGFYIYIHARRNKITKFNIKIKKCIEIMNLPSYEEVKKGNKNYSDRIINRIEGAINFLPLYLELKMNFSENYIDYQNRKISVLAFILNGSIEITIENEEIKKLYHNIKVEEERKKMSKNSDNKFERKLKCKKFLGQGKTDKEIAEILKLSIKTIKRYIEEIEDEQSN